MTSVTLNAEPDAVSDQAHGSKWSLHLRYLGIAAVAILALFWRDLWAMVSLWWNISTYNHCLLIAPIIIWLVQQRRDELIKIAPAIWAPGLIWIAVAAFGWLLGEAAGVAFARQLGVIMMLQGLVITILGRNVARGLTFPLFYSFFMVPFGEEIVPFLQTVTAKMSMTFLGWTDIPAFIDGIFISTPTGYFEVAEACSGVKFLIAMIAYGALVSNVCFQSWDRRILFMTAAVLVPVLANGIRAFGTIYIAHHTSIDFASGFDHILYGWFFFAFVLILVMALGWPFFDRKIDDRMIDGARLNGSQTTAHSGWNLRHAMIAIGLVVVVPMLWMSAISAQNSPIPEKIALPEVPGWKQIDYRPLYEWKPRFDGANHQLLGRFENASTGAQVDLVIAVYDRQEDNREIVGYGQGGFDPRTEWSWTRDLTAPESGSAIQLTAPGPVVRDIVSFYRIGGIMTGSGSAVKLETLKAKLFGGNQQAVAVLVSAEKTSDAVALDHIEAFLKDIGPIDKLADEMAGLR